MNEKIEKIEKNKTWTLVPRPKAKNVIGTKWVFRNKMNEQGEVIRNKERLVCKGCSQKEGIDYEETYAPIARMEAVRMFLAYAKNNNFKVYQMDVKSTFLNGELDEEVYIKQFEILISCISHKHSYCFHSGHRCICFLIIYSFFL